MSEDIQEIQELLEKMALHVVMLEPGDLPGWGIFLDQLSQLKDKVPSDGPGLLAEVIDDLEQVSQKIILEEIEALAEAQELLSQGMGLLLSWCREGSPGVDQGQAQTYQHLANQLGLGKESLPESGQEPGAESAAEPDTVVAEMSSVTTLDLAADQELVQNFITEALEHLDSIETQIVYLEQDPTDKERINAIFRPFHTIKGVAGFLNLDQIQTFAHELETLLDEARGGRLSITGVIIDFILNAVDILKEMINDLYSSLETGKPLQVIDLKPYQVTIKGFLKGEAEAGRETEKRTIGEILLDQGVVQQNDLEDALEKQREIKKSSSLGQILVTEGKVPPQKIAQALVQQMQEQPSGRDTSVSQTIKIDVQKLDFLVDMMGELVIVQSQVQQNPLVQGLNDQKLVRNFSQMARITSELQKISMSLRMVPIGQTFQKMVRVVRDLSRKSGKMVDLHLAGEDTEIDRNMVETIYDPLVHMVRNSVDHGLEIPAHRAETGKSEKGNLWLRAYHKGGNVVIEIEDDGQGLNRERIIAKARDQGLLQEGENLTSTQIDNLIFEPGFSTAAQITDVSGRGVGMDVVKKTIDNLRGKIEISSHTGKGSRFTIRLPLTLAIIEGMIVQVGNERYIIPTIAVQQTLRPAAEDYHTVQAKGEMIKVRNSLLPLLRLHHMFGVAAARQHPTEALVLVVENEGEQKCIMVDQIVGKQEVVIKSLGETFNNVKGLAGGTILGDGRVGLILDLNGLFALSKGSAATFH